MLKHQALWESSFPEFLQCGESKVVSLMESATLVKIPAGQLVFSSGSSCENYLLLLTGCVKTQLLSEGGREMLLYQVLPGDSCVLTTSCLLSGDEYPAEAYTVEDTSAFVISSHAFYRCLEQSAFFREFVFKNFSARLSSVICRLGEVVFEGIQWRLAKELLSSNVESLQLTHQDLASKLGSAREVISRNLKQFEAKGWVKLNRGAVVILDRDALKKLIQER